MIESKYFKYHPLGIIFHKRLPIEVQDFHFNSYGEYMGVQIGWVVTRIADEDVRNATEYNDVDRLLLARLSKYPWWPLKVEFKKPSGAKEVIHFAKQPLGLVFSRRAPIKIESFKKNSYGQSMGVQEGWVMTKLADVEIQDDHNFKHVDDLLLDGLSRLEPIAGLKLLKTKSTGSYRSKSQENRSNDGTPGGRR